MRKRIVIFSILVIIIMTVLTSCSNNDTAGILKRDNGTYYFIELNSVDDIDNYFTKTGEVQQISVSNVNDGSSSTMVKCSEIEEGGWIAYYNNRVIYADTSVKVDDLEPSSYTMLAKLTTSDDFITIDEAKEYLTWIE